jgi:hypothetical protein
MRASDQFGILHVSFGCCNNCARKVAKFSQLNPRTIGEIEPKCHNNGLKRFCAWEVKSIGSAANKLDQTVARAGGPRENLPVDFDGLPGKSPMGYDGKPSEVQKRGFGLLNRL